jgi:hypothetical protein
MTDITLTPAQFATLLDLIGNANAALSVVCTAASTLPP